MGKKWLQLFIPSINPIFSITNPTQPAFSLLLLFLSFFLFLSLSLRSSTLSPYLPRGPRNSCSSPISTEWTHLPRSPSIHIPLFSELFSFSLSLPLASNLWILTANQVGPHSYRERLKEEKRRRERKKKSRSSQKIACLFNRSQRRKTLDGNNGAITTLINRSSAPLTEKGGLFRSYARLLPLLLTRHSLTSYRVW